VIWGLTYYLLLDLGLHPMVSDVWLFVAAGLAAGLTLGVPQWLALRRVMRRVNWWLPASAAAFVASGALIWLSPLAANGSFSSLMLILLLFPLLSSPATGLALAWLAQPGTGADAR
jgi:hypothetical protein